MNKKTQPVAEARDAQVSFKVPTSTKRALERAAASDRRSVSTMAMVILETWLKEKGFLK
jgi:uncharacterized protein (DUF1778 family)